MSMSKGVGQFELERPRVGRRLSHMKARTAPIKRMRLFSSGKMPTTQVRRLISSGSDTKLRLVPSPRAWCIHQSRYLVFWAAAFAGWILVLDVGIRESGGADPWW